MIEALIEYFVGHETVRKCAISNTAARLIGGDTLHAVCKLPREDLQSRAGKLSHAVLTKLRQKWRTSQALFIDEISMVAPEQLFQTEVRSREVSLVCVPPHSSPPPRPPTPLTYPSTHIGTPTSSRPTTPRVRISCKLLPDCTKLLFRNAMGLGWAKVAGRDARVRSAVKGRS